MATGYKFGGVVAHLFATRVLLQLHQEVQLARQMGINLSMTLADKKVSLIRVALDRRAERMDQVSRATMRR